MRAAVLMAAVCACSAGTQSLGRRLGAAEDGGMGDHPTGDVRDGTPFDSRAWDGAGGTGGRTDGPGASDGAADGAAAICRRIDLVFAVDDSRSMEEEQKAMRDTVFPAFANKLIEKLPTLQDFRAGVVDGCPTPANFHTRGESGECGFSSGKPWMDSRSSRLAAEFGCVGEVYSGDALCSGGSGDSHEQPVTAAATSLEPATAGPGGPNAGFLRDDAVLVVVAITDEDEKTVPERSAQQIYDRLVAIKGGDVRRMVFVGIGGESDCASGAYGGARESFKLKELTNLFTAKGRGVFWNLCAGNLEDGLEAALAIIGTACHEICGTTSCS